MPANSFERLGDRIWNAVYQGSGVKQTVDMARTGKVNPDKGVQDWIQGINAGTGLPEQYRNTKLAIDDFDNNSLYGGEGANWIDTSWRLINSKDSEPVYKYTVEEPLYSIGHELGGWLGMTDAEFVNLISGVGGGWGSEWGAGVGAGGSDIADSSSNEALTATGTGLVSGGLGDLFSWLGSGTGGTTSGTASTVSGNADVAGLAAAESAAANVGTSSSATAASQGLSSAAGTTTTMTAEEVAMNAGAEGIYSEAANPAVESNSIDYSKITKALSKTASSYAKSQQKQKQKQTVKQPSLSATAGEQDAIRRQKEDEAAQSRKSALAGDNSGGISALYGVGQQGGGKQEDTSGLGQKMSELARQDWYNKLYQGLGEYTY